MKLRALLVRALGEDRTKDIRRYLTTWAFRIGLILLVPICIYLPWRQEFLWRVAEDTTVPIRAVRYRFFWDPPLDASLDLGRLAFELLVLAVIVMLVYQYERPGRRETPVATSPTLAYSEVAWSAEMRERDRGDQPRACPACRRTGFYGPREDEAGRHYRMCQFCGFFQSVGEARAQLRPCVHPCGLVREVAGAPYITWVPREQLSYYCESCKGEAAVAESLVTSPAEDADHPWWRVPQQLSHQEYVRFWLTNGAPGRVYL
ncbi:MAG: hypothetical protein JSV41_10395 [Gemmatimonadota bacterium]|nr:MAG: hypothetical protein JSV41_10395 [Gemmatimonadota bacterium]